ncbi:hypothetical protein ACQKKG_13420 [Brevundimonas sp. NPDC003935]|uniref:hypothetical protein n=1 Tax=unclassified Brevundimonas TaxID=2622653 RepID=UPI002899CE4B|nr:hypothetical protein [Brevundimonas sp.]
MDPYSIIDAQLDRRAAENGWTVVKEWAEAPARFFYIGGRAPFDCFQIVIDPPAADAVVVTARSVDSNDDQEFEQTWRGGVAEFDSLLSSALALVETWRSRAP